MTAPLPDIVLIGAGNVGFHLGKRLAARGMKPVQVFSRSEEPARRLGEALDTPFTNDIEAIRPEANLYILAVRDDAIGNVAARLAPLLSGRPLIVHTSGATPSSVLAGYTSHYGVFYPLQTFSREREVDFDTVPFCIDAAREADARMLEQVAQRISTRVYRIDDRQRAILHVAAVFVNNFTNHLLGIGQDILDREGLPFDLLRPLILETARKVQDHPPAAMQTGPAVRGDQATIERHLDYLDKFPAYRELYRLLTVNIQRNTKAN